MTSPRRSAVTAPRPRPPLEHDQFTAGTAGDGYLVAPAEHDCEPTTPEPGERSRCRHCHRERVSVRGTQHTRSETR